MTEQIMKLLKSRNEEDNVIGLMLFKKMKITHKAFCTYLHENRDTSTDRHYSSLAYKYFVNYQYSQVPRLRYKYRRILK